MSQSFIDAVKAAYIPLLMKYPHKATVELVEIALTEVMAEAGPEDCNFEPKTCPEAYLQQRIAELQARLEASGTPVAWINKRGDYVELSTPSTVYGSHTIPLFTAPPADERDARIAKLEAERDRAQKNATQYDLECSKHSHEITRLRGEVVELRTQLAVAQAEIAELNTQLENEIESHR